MPADADARFEAALNQRLDNLVVEHLRLRGSELAGTVKLVEDTSLQARVEAAASISGPTQAAAAIPSQLDCLDMALNDADQLLVMLENRLRPVLNRNSGAGKDGMVVDSECTKPARLTELGASSVAAAIGSAQYRTSMLGSRLGALLGQLDLQ